MHILQEFSLGDAIVNIFTNDECTHIVTNTLKLFQYNSEYKLQYTHELQQDKELHNYSRAIAYAKKDFALLPIADSHEAKIYTFIEYFKDSNRAIEQNDDIESALFSENSKLLMIGDTAGRCIIYNTITFSVVTSLKPKPDYINAIAISEKNRYIMTSSYNKSATIFDLSRGRNKATFSCSDVIESSIFVNNSTLLSVLQNGAIQVYDIKKEKITFEKNLLSFWPSHIVGLNEAYYLITTRTEHAYLFNIETKKIDFNFNLTYKGVTSICKYKHRIVLGFENGSVQIIDINYLKDAFEVAIKVNSIADAKKHVKHNPFLQIHPKYQELLENSFEEDLQQALNKIGEHLVTNAKESMKVHIDHERYSEFENFVKYTDEITRFYKVVKDRDLSTAYILVHEIPILKKTPAYARLEIIWHNSFNRSKKMLQQDHIGFYKTAENVLRPFAKIPEKKVLIGHLFNHVEVFTDAENAVKAQNFELYFDYVSKHSFLEDTKIYEKIVLVAAGMYEQMLEFEEINKFEKVTHIIATLKTFNLYKKEILETLQRIEIKNKFNDKVMQKDYDSAFKMIDEYDYIQSLPKAVRLEAKFQSDVEKIEALAPMPTDVLKELSTYVSINTCKERIAIVMQQAYEREMYKYAKHDIIIWKVVFERYMSIYSEDTIVEKFAKISGRVKEYEEAVITYKYIGVKNSKLLGSIMVKRTK